MKKIYVAGPYSAPDVLSVFSNMRKGITLSVQVRKLGFAPYCPWMDFQYYLHDGSFTLANCYEYSMAWLEVSDGIIFTPDWRDSQGAQEEHTYAIEHHIPIFYELMSLVDYFDLPQSRPKAQECAGDMAKSLDDWQCLPSKRQKTVGVG